MDVKRTRENISIAKIYKFNEQRLKGMRLNGQRPNGLRLYGQRLKGMRPNGMTPTDLLLSDWLSSMVLPPVVLAGPRVLPSVALFGIAAVLVVSFAVIVPPMVLGGTVFASNYDKIYFI